MKRERQGRKIQLFNASCTNLRNEFRAESVPRFSAATLNIQIERITESSNALECKPEFANKSIRDGRRRMDILISPFPLLPIAENRRVELTSIVRPSPFPPSLLPSPDCCALLEHFFPWTILRARVLNTHTRTRNACDRWLKNATTPLLPLPQQTTLSLSPPHFFPSLLPQHASSSSWTPRLALGDPPFVLMNEIARFCHASPDALMGLGIGCPSGGKKITKGERDANVLFI